ncbi:MAG: hypothetical protein KA408_15915 [Flavobacteriales bacterium]|nr:hypothetical protein [Flavobacteriales bacterium]
MFFGITGCGISQYDQLAVQVATAFQTDDVKITYSTMLDTRSETQRTLIATLYCNPQKSELWKPKVKVASGCAKFIFEKLNDEQQKDLDQVQIILVSNGDEAKFNFHMDYLKSIDPYLNVVHNYLHHVSSKEYSALVSLIDSAFVSPEDQQSFLHSYAQIDSVHGGQGLPNIEGFKLDTLNYSGSLPIVQVWAITESPDVVNHYRFILSNDNLPPRVLAIGLNDE